MALESWLMKVKSAISIGVSDVVRAAAAVPNAAKLPNTKKPKTIGILAFEVAGIMSKLLHLWQSLSDHHAIRLRNDAIFLEGVRKIVSNDDAFLLALACAETVETLRSLSRSIAGICRRSDDPKLRSFQSLFAEFADSGRDPHGWVFSSCKEMDSKNRKLDRYVSVTAALCRAMEDLMAAENALRKSSSQYEVSSSPPPTATAKAKEQQRIADLQQKISIQKQQIRNLKQKSLWRKSFDSVSLLLVRSIFTVLARIKLVFGVGQAAAAPASLSRSLSASAVVYPSESSSTGCDFTSGPLNLKVISKKLENENHHRLGFLESNAKLLKPPASTLGSAALALHYANLIIVMEKMIKSPQLVGADAREDLYGMLPASIRAALRSRLRGVGFCGGDPKLAGEWRDALGRIMGWILPLAQNMIKWQSERSFEQQQQQSLGPKTNVLLLQTLFFANKEKTEAAIVELLVGLNYIWRFEREMTAKALFECSKFNLQQHSSLSLFSS